MLFANFSKIIDLNKYCDNNISNNNNIYNLIGIINHIGTTNNGYFISDIKKNKNNLIIMEIYIFKIQNIQLNNNATIVFIYEKIKIMIVIF